MRTQILRRLLTVAVASSVILLLATQTVVGKSLPIPASGQKYTISRLLDLIRTNEKGSQFFVLKKEGAASIKEKDIKRPLTDQVTLHQDNALIQVLMAKHHLDTDTKDKYTRLLLFFKDKDDTKIFLNNPWPGQIKRMGRRVERTVDRYINKWDFTAVFPPG